MSESVYCRDVKNIQIKIKKTLKYVKNEHIIKNFLKRWIKKIYAVSKEEHLLKYVIDVLVRWTSVPDRIQETLNTKSLQKR